MTNEWRTLEEIYKEVEKFPFEVEIESGNYGPYLIHGFSRDNHFISEDRDSSTSKWPINRLAKLYTPPKLKKKIKFHDVVYTRDLNRYFRSWMDEVNLKNFAVDFSYDKFTILKTEEVEVD